MASEKARIGVDLGGTKIAAIVLGKNDDVLAKHRLDSPKEDYQATIGAILDVTEEVKKQAGCDGCIGIGIPGSVSPATGKIQNANSTWLNGQPLPADLERALGQPVKLANDANCFTLSEALDGAGRDAKTVFGVILGTGCGGGFVAEGQLNDGPRAIGGEWGHNPLPWATEHEIPGPECWCSKQGCMESWVSGPALAADHELHTGENIDAVQIAERAQAGSATCQETLGRHADRLARGLSVVVNILDPECIVLGGGLSRMAHLYADLPALMAPFIFSDRKEVDVRPPEHGAESGVRGAARLWDNAAQGQYLPGG